ncbi:nucleoside deaminase [Georgenia ruanii]|uniref:Nucleoside deaminase n=1 Tax=Georgenia ruanii TaxID=348442 RepID=A0A7J9UXP4_9MICO|nr:nucleoside deaminase [Georgenia ruanii]MPV88640.1 nucleoside deaminase [Georgenia ruanii]
MATESQHLERCIELATEAAAAGDEPFGSVLAGGDGEALAEARNRVVTTGDPMAHPELALARWAATHLSPAERAAATMYTSGEHCPMCAAAHGLVGLGPIVYIHSLAQLVEWRQAVGLPGPRVAPLPIQEVAPGVSVEGPMAGLDDRMHLVHDHYLRGLLGEA